MIFTKTHVNENRGTRTYQSEEGLTLYVPKSAGEQPDQFAVEGLNMPAEKPSKAKLTPEEKKAAAAERRAKNAGLTPAQKIEAEELRIAKRQEAIAKRKAALANAGSGGDAASAPQ